MPSLPSLLNVYTSHSSLSPLHSWFSDLSLLVVPLRLPTYFPLQPKTPKTRIPVMCWITWVPSLSLPVLLSPGGLHNQVLLLLPPDFWGLLHFLEAQFLTHHSFLRKFIWFPREKTRPLIWFSKASEIWHFSVFPLLLFPGLLTVKLPSDRTSCCPS